MCHSWLNGCQSARIKASVLWHHVLSVSLVQPLAPSHCLSPLSPPLATSSRPQFGKRLLREASRTRCASSYIDYKQLKHAIKQDVAARGGC